MFMTNGKKYNKNSKIIVLYVCPWEYISAFLAPRFLRSSLRSAYQEEFENCYTDSYRA